ncbi:MAG: hypothetical protein WCI88_06155 [Chloroflexota bacterium]
MTQITPDHINRLITLESEIHYDKPPLYGLPFRIIEHKSPVLISAPHGARTFRNNGEQVWHEEDEFTAGMALLLGEVCAVSVIATHRRNDVYDPNYSDVNVPYKQAMGRLIEQQHVRFVLDLHGAALNSTTLGVQTIDLGLRQNGSENEPSMDLVHVTKLESLLLNTEGAWDGDCFVVGRNKFPGAGKGTMTTFTASQKVEGTDKYVQSFQIEMKPQVRVANRFPSATLYQSCGGYLARVENVIHMLQSLVDFIEYLKENVE